MQQHHADGRVNDLADDSRLGYGCTRRGFRDCVGGYPETPAKQAVAMSQSPQPPTRVRDRHPTERERIAEDIARRMDKPVSVLGIIFLLLVVSDTALANEGGLRRWFDIAAWVLWAVFAFEFVLRLVIAPSAWSYLRRHWWQVIFLVVPFLRFLRVAGRLARLRPGRLARVLSSALRGMKTATRKLSSRLAWLSSVTAIVILASSQLLFEFGHFDSYGRALHDAAYATIAGEAIESESLVADVLELLLAVYSVVVFAFLAGMLGAYMLEGGREQSGGEHESR